MLKRTSREYSLIQNLRLRWIKKVFFVCFPVLEAPTITPAFSSPLRVVEGESVTLEWTFNLHGKALNLMLFSLQSGTIVVQKVQTTPSFIPTIFRGRIAENITESFASIKFLSINRTDSKTYTMTVSNLEGGQTSGTVEIQVHCKLWMPVNYYILLL